MKYEAFIKAAGELVPIAKRLLSTDKYHAPILYLFDKKWVPYVVVVEKSGDTPMHVYVEALCRGMDSVAFIMVNEAWVGSGITPEQYQAGDFTRPSKLPEHQRNEALIVHAVHPGGAAMWNTPFIRGEHNIVMDETVFIDGARLGGGMSDILKRVKERPL